ncbi:MAG: efflux RND transporter periplasmic adaptor subunit [Pseudomonadota bacterium]
MKKIKAVLLIAIILFGLVFIFNSLKKSSVPPGVAQPPDLARAPARVYGLIEPAGREVFVCPAISRRVVELFVKEGDTVKQGQRLCDLESSIEQAQVSLSEARAASVQKSLEISMDDLSRTKNLFVKQVDSEFKYTQSQLQNALELKRLKVANCELDVAKAQLEQTVLRSPVDGTIYKFDVRLGESLQAGDSSRIIIGSPDVWVRLSVESFWKDKVKAGAECKVYDSETREYLGTGKVISRTQYMGRRNFRTEDLQERFDTKFQEVVLELKPEKKNIPLGLSVVAEL